MSHLTYSVTGVVHALRRRASNLSARQWVNNSAGRFRFGSDPVTNIAPVCVATRKHRIHRTGSEFDLERHAHSGTDIARLAYTTCGLSIPTTNLNTLPAMTSDNNPSNIDYAALIGLDWGDAQHAIALRSSDSQQVETSMLDHSPEHVRAWLKQLEERFGGRPVAIALETSKGPLIHMFADVPWLTVHPIHPATSARIRKAFRPSGAKDDTPDARVLLNLLLFHREQLRPLAWEDEATRRLEGLCQLRRRTVDRRTQLGNQLLAVLKSYYPQAVELVGETLHSPLALAFLKKWPDLIGLKTSRPGTIRKFYHHHRVRRPEIIDQRLKRIDQAVALTNDEAVVQTGKREVARLTQELALLQEHIHEDEQLIKEAFASHPDAFLFRELPGAGPAMAPRLLVAFGTDRDRYPACTSFQRYCGVAPVTEKSGDRTWVHWRWGAPKFLRQTLLEWAGLSVQYSPWAGAYYQQQRKRGKNRWSILRSLAFIWIRILWKCWQTRVPYDEERYLKQLRKRGSSLVQPA